MPSTNIIDGINQPRREVMYFIGENITVYIIIMYKVARKRCLVSFFFICFVAYVILKPEKLHA